MPLPRPFIGTILGSKLPRIRRMPDQVAQVTQRWRE